MIKLLFTILLLLLAAPAFGTVAYCNGNTPANSTGNFSFSFTPSCTPGAILLWVLQDSASGVSQVSTPTYGGVIMVAAAGSPVCMASQRCIYKYFLGSNIPTGLQTVVVNVTGSANKSVTVLALSSARNTEYVDVDTTINGTGANPSVTMALAGRTAFVAIGFVTNITGAGNITPTAGWSVPTAEVLFTNPPVGAVYKYDTIASSDVAAGWTQASASSSAIAVAVTEVLIGGGVIGGGFGTTMID